MVLGAYFLNICYYMLKMTGKRNGGGGLLPIFPSEWLKLSNVLSLILQGHLTQLMVKV